MFCLGLSRCQNLREPRCRWQMKCPRRVSSWALATRERVRGGGCVPSWSGALGAFGRIRQQLVPGSLLGKQGSDVIGLLPDFLFCSPCLHIFLVCFRALFAFLPRFSKISICHVACFPSWDVSPLIAKDWDCLCAPTSYLLVDICRIQRWIWCWFMVRTLCCSFSSVSWSHPGKDHHSVTNCASCNQNTWDQKCFRWF